MSAFGGSRVGLRSSVAARAPLSVTCAYGTTPKVGGGKRWKHTEVNVNGNPVKVEMHIKKGDTVQASSRFGLVFVCEALTITCGSTIAHTSPRIGPHSKSAHQEQLECVRCIQVIAGRDKGTIGTITKVVTSTGKCVVEGVNIKTKHIAPRTEKEVGSIKKSEYPIHHSNVMLYSKEKGVRSRVGSKVTEEGKKVSKDLMGRIMWRNRVVRTCMMLFPVPVLSTNQPGIKAIRQYMAFHPQMCTCIRFRLYTIPYLP